MTPVSPLSPSLFWVPVEKELLKYIPIPPLVRIVMDAMENIEDYFTQKELKSIFCKIGLWNKKKEESPELYNLFFTMPRIPDLFCGMALPSFEHMTHPAMGFKLESGGYGICWMRESQKPVRREVFRGHYYVYSCSLEIVVTDRDRESNYPKAFYQSQSNLWFEALHKPGDNVIEFPGQRHLPWMENYFGDQLGKLDDLTTNQLWKQFQSMRKATEAAQREFVKYLESLTDS